MLTKCGAEVTVIDIYPIDIRAVGTAVGFVHLIWPTFIV